MWEICVFYSSMTSCVVTRLSTNVLNDLKKDWINEFGIIYCTSNPIWVKFQEHGSSFYVNIEEKVWLLVKKISNMPVIMYSYVRNLCLLFQYDFLCSHQAFHKCSPRGSLEIWNGHFYSWLNYYKVNNAISGESLDFKSSSYMYIRAFQLYRGVGHIW
jgi:hypothetical protein